MIKVRPDEDRSSRYFDSSALLKDLGSKSARGGVVTLGAQGARFILQIGSTVILARLLTPEDFGLVGMVAVLINFVVFFRDLGLTQATVQRSEITRQQISNLFWINTSMSVLVAGVFALASPLVAEFYERRELVAITLILAAGVLIEGLGLQHRALMMRTMEFSKLAVADIGSQILAVVFAVYLGAAGFGYWALIGLTVSGAVFRTLFFFLNTRWLPSLPKRLSGTKPFIKYGSNLFGFNIVNFFTRNADNLLIGKFIGAEALGLYSNAYRLLLIPVQQVSGPLGKVYLPTLSRLVDQPKRFAEQYYNLMLILTMLSIPAVMLVLISAQYVIPALLGEGWEMVPKILLALGPAALAGSINSAGSLVLSATGNTPRLLRIGIFNSVATVSGFLIGINYGVIGIAVAFSLVQVPMQWIGWVYCFKDTAISPNALLKTIAVPFLIALLASVASMLTLVSSGVSGEIAKSLFLAFIFSGVVLLSYILHPRTRYIILKAITLLKKNL
jgi:O-antigen/teichoic acid export membrane protein